MDEKQATELAVWAAHVLPSEDKTHNYSGLWKFIKEIEAVFEVTWREDLKAFVKPL
jgi:hypothetical protein